MVAKSRRNPWVPRSSPPSATAAGDAWSFSTDFLGLGSRRAVDVALHRPTRKVTNRRLARGVYDFPKHHPRLEPPAPRTVARAIAGRDHVRLQPAGAYAANALGLTAQVPAHVVFLTDGIRRKGRDRRHDHPAAADQPRNMEPAGRQSGLLIQAFRELGKEHSTPERIAHLKRTVPTGERGRPLDDFRLAPTWMHPIFRDLAAQP